MANYRLLLEYDGTDFAGWQAQAGRRTVQGALEAAITRVTGRRAAVMGAGRTDAGVHAEGQVANVQLETRVVPAALARALNAVLPRDVAVVRLARAPGSFHARRDARSKFYRYMIWNGRAPSPLRARRSVWVRAALDLDAMREAAAALVGEHDFASFQASGSSVLTTRRTLTRLELRGRGAGALQLEVEGSGFLRHMVRTLAGTLLEVGRGRRAADSMAELLAARDRRRAGPTAPARGLTLVRVEYGFRPPGADLRRRGS